MPIARGYRHVHEDEESEPDTEVLQKSLLPRVSSTPAVYGICLAFGLIIVVLGIFVGVPWHWGARQHTNADFSSGSTLHCGHSSTETQSLGCVFDLLTNNWMPEACADPYTDSEYRDWVMQSERKLGSFAFFYDQNATRHIHTEDLLSTMVDEHVYTTVENHLAHCAFLARRMHRLVTGEIAAVAHNTFSHTVHCTSALLKSLEDRPKDTQGNIEMSTFDVGIVSCVL